MRTPDSETWRLRATDRFGRSLTLTRDGVDFTLVIERSSQQDEGERIGYLTPQIIRELNEIVEKR